MGQHGLVGVGETVGEHTNKKLVFKFSNILISSLNNIIHRVSLLDKADNTFLLMMLCFLLFCGREYRPAQGLLLTLGSGDSPANVWGNVCNAGGRDRTLVHYMQGKWINLD